MSTPFTFGSLFTGIGGIDLGLERAGMQCLWQVEIDDYATQVLEKHWPHVTRFRDVRAVGRETLARVDLIAGGFPCQPHSLAGRRKASEDERDLWGEFHRIIRELKPRWIVAENVLGLLSSEDGTFFSGILRDLAQGGYDAEWQVLSAQALGAPHLRERIFLVAYSSSSRLQECSASERLHHQSHPSSALSNASCDGRYRGQLQPQPWQLAGETVIGTNGDGESLADTTSDGRHSWRTECQGQQRELCPQWSGPSLAHPNFQGLEVGKIFGGDAATQLTAFKRDCSTGTGIRTTESNVGRVAHGVPARVDRLRGLGNAVVPQVAEYVGRCILSAVEQGV